VCVVLRIEANPLATWDVALDVIERIKSKG